MTRGEKVLSRATESGVVPAVTLSWLDTLDPGHRDRERTWHELPALALRVAPITQEGTLLAAGPQQVGVIRLQLRRVPCGACNHRKEELEGRPGRGEQVSASPGVSAPRAAGESGGSVCPAQTRGPGGLSVLGVHVQPPALTRPVRAGHALLALIERTRDTPAVLTTTAPGGPAGQPPQTLCPQPGQPLCPGCGLTPSPSRH